MIYSQKCFSLCSVAVSQSWVFDKMVHVSVTVHEIQDRAHLYPAGRPLPWGAWTSKWERQTGSRDLSSAEAEVAMLWAARLFAVMFPPWPLQLLVRLPGLQGTFILQRVTSAPQDVPSSSSDVSSLSLVSHTMWNTQEWVTFFIFPDLEFCLYKTNLCFCILIPTLPF